MDKGIGVSVVLPCLNEEKTLALCIHKIREVFNREKISGEIIVVDNASTDRSKEIALSLGVKLLEESYRGYGAAYLKGLREARGEFIVIADSDNTYDFYELPLFIRKLQEGYDFVIGSRFKGRMSKDAMPWLNRYLGNPLLSRLCQLFFRTGLTDIHCGMRAFRAASYRKLQLKTLGMEFATEMVVSALQNNLKICEVPVAYHCRVGKSKLSPFRDAWRHIRFMLFYCPLWLYFIPGLIGLVLSLSFLLLMLRGPFLFLGRHWDLHLMIFMSMLAILSFQVLNIGIFAHTFAIRQGFLKYDRVTLFFQRRFNLEKGLLAGGLVFLAGLAMLALIFGEWFLKKFGPLYRIREAILAMTLLVIGIQTLFSSFFISLLFLEKE
jgi:glycosyltransferase involved in cell wall biosynthesis